MNENVDEKWADAMNSQQSSPERNYYRSSMMMMMVEVDYDGEVYDSYSNGPHSGHIEPSVT